MPIPILWAAIAGGAALATGAAIFFKGKSNRKALSENEMNSRINDALNRGDYSVLNLLGGPEVKPKKSKPEIILYGETGAGKTALYHLVLGDKDAVKLFERMKENKASNTTDPKLDLSNMGINKFLIDTPGSIPQQSENLAQTLTEDDTILCVFNAENYDTNKDIKRFIDLGIRRAKDKGANVKIIGTRAGKISKEKKEAIEQELKINSSKELGKAVNCQIFELIDGIETADDLNRLRAQVFDFLKA